MKKNECLRCGHKWIPRIEGKPKSCPSCKNRLWDEVRKMSQTEKYFLEHRSDVAEIKRRGTWPGYIGG